MATFELAQLNVAHLKAPIDSPLLAEFVANLDRINGLADTSDGFRWRLKTEGGDATSLRPLGDDVVVNMSVWRDLGSLRRFVYRTAHADVMKRRPEWFIQAPEAYIVLWWVPQGHRPSIDEAASRLARIREFGPSTMAFTFGKAFPAPDATLPECPTHADQ